MSSRSTNLLRRFFAPVPTTKKPRTKLQFQSLEDRAVPATYTVTSLADSGAGSLREAVTTANGTADADVINFDSGLIGGGATITLTTALPDIPSAGGALTITGPGMNLLTINRTAGTLRFFNQTATTAANTLTITDMTVKDGNASGGGALQYTGVVVLERMKFENNISTATGGATRGLTGSSITVRDSIFTGNKGTTGGAIYTASSAPTIIVERSVFNTNEATSSNGGAIRVGSGGFLSVKDTTISGNKAVNKGGGIYHFGTGGIFIENTTISGNSTTSVTTSNGGGALYMFGSPSAAPPTGFVPNTYVIRNSTIANNTAAGSGGGILDKSGALTGIVLIENTTISGNTASNASATYGGGGIMRTSSSGKTFNIVNSIVAGNFHTGGSNVNIRNASTTGVVNINFSAIDNTTGFTPSGSSGNNVTSSFASLNLGALANNGGLTQTMFPGSGPLINAGSNALVSGAVTTDQRGAGFARILGGTVDIGAVEGIPPGNPVASATAPNITTAGGTTQTFTVDFSDLVGPNLGLDDTTIINNNNAIRVTGPNGYNELATYVSIDTNGDPNNSTATYTIPAPGGSWGTEDAGTYTISAEANQVFDLNGEALLVATLDTFTSAIQQTLVVTNTTDADPGSLRDIITLANADINPDTITFDSSVFNTPQTISLLSALPTFGSVATAGVTTISGPGSALLTVQRDGGAGTNFGIFASTQPLTMSGITVTGGNAGNAGILLASGGTLTDMVFNANTSTAPGTVRSNAGTLNLIDSQVTLNNTTGDGGGVFLAAGTLNVTNSLISGNTTTDDGGGIYAAGATTTNITDSTVADNVATSGAYGDGGGLFVGSGGTAIVKNSTFSGNSSNDDGGAIYFFLGGTLVVENSTLNGNSTTTSAAGGGAIYFYGTPTSFVIRNSTLTGNTTATNGGAIVWPTSGGNLLVENSTIYGNTANGANGGGIARTGGSGTITINNSIVSNNTNGASPDIFSAGTVTTKASAIGSLTGFTDASGAGNIAPGTDLMLGALADYGAPTQLMIPQPGSPLIDAGDQTLIPGTTLTDQVGGTHLRVFGANVDIGAYEIQPPSVTVNQAVGQADPTNGSITFDIVFNMAVADFDIGDLTLTSAVGGSVTGFTGSGAVYQATVTGMTGQGNVEMSVAADVATDATGQTNSASTHTDNVVLFDELPPTVEITQSLGQADPTNGASISFDVTFSDPMTGFDESDIVLASSTAPGLLVPVVTPTGPGTYQVVVTGMTGDGDVVIEFAANAATDLAGNGNLAPTLTDNIVKFDNTAPTVTIDKAGTQADPSGGSATAGVQFTVVFSEPVTDFTAADVYLMGSTAPGVTVTNITGSGTTYTVTVGGMTGSGIVKASVLANGAIDAATNGNNASTSTDNEVDFTLSGTVQFSSATYSISEQGSPQLTITVTRTDGSDGPLSVDFTTSDGTAVAGTDYDTASGTLTWLAGDSADKTFTVDITDDSNVEGDLNFNVALSNASLAGALGTPSSAVVTITDYEEGDITFDAPTYTAAEGGTATITVKRLNGGDGIASVTYDLTLVTAEAGDIGTPSIAAGTLTWADGETADKVITIPIIDEALSEAYETINLEVSAPSAGVSLGNNPTATLTIDPSDAVRISGLNAFKPIKLVDTDLDTITVSFGGKTGFLDIFKTDDQAPIGLMVVGGGADPLKASVAVKVSKAKASVSPTADGKSSIGAIEGTGLKGITATKSDLIGTGINLTGSLGSVKIGNILNGADIIAAGAATQKTAITAGTIGDGTTIQLGSILNSLKATSFGDSDIVAPSAGKITVNGSFNGDITLSGLGVDHVKGKKTLSALAVKGVVTGADINVTGNIGSVTSLGFVDSRLFGSYAGPDDGTGVFNTVTPTTIGSFKTTANAKLGFTGLFDNSFIIASRLTSASFADVDEAHPTAFGVYLRDGYKSISILDVKKKFTAGDQTEGNFNIKDV